MSSLNDKVLQGAAPKVSPSWSAWLSEGVGRAPPTETLVEMFPEPLVPWTLVRL